MLTKTIIKTSNGIFTSFIAAPATVLKHCNLKKNVKTLVLSPIDNIAKGRHFEGLSYVH